MERYCLDCKSPVTGRSDKKFCDHQCRSNYYNHNSDEELGQIRVINKILRKNRTILKKLNPSGKTKVSLQKLLSYGFDPNYHTHSYHTHKKDTYLFCYEYGYLRLEKDEYLLVKKYQEK